MRSIWSKGFVRTIHAGCLSSFGCWQSCTRPGMRKIAMALAAFVNPDEGTVALQRRVDAIAESRARLSVLAS